MPASIARCPIQPHGDGPALFISDLHLSPALPRTVQVFEDFLRGPAREASALFILGDLFEYWVGDDMLDDDGSPLGEFTRRMTGLIAALAATGVPIAVMRGNRDFLLGARFARAAGATLLPDPSLVELHGQRLVLSHGDALCLDDVGYLRYRRVAHSWLGKRFFLALPRHWRMAVADRIRRNSAAKGARLRVYADVTPSAVRELLTAAHETTLVHGHTHRPARHVDGAFVRWVLPDWEFDIAPPRGGYLQWDAHGLRAIDLSASA
ncbi:UDP-2,3-diacylglucosamine diphosphatase [Pandoraea terrae]|uniref:UDP-2,3-diacylglucosamine hydrolase n=1 Tax=Pandoraea terrae TaxID=1537710 RepID=A0A5E4ZDA0_9BURK|nr:UDP-2,3-diacylglucosamine diphosphatase [Pandoraea terrae]VVE59006.1 UDP-2,3-diacylglucosamine diphosphatase [Pandoraea terrae]